MSKSKAKPLSFNTTIRNPERIPNFLRCILPYEGKVLTSDVIHEIIKNIIREKEYKPLYIGRNDNLKLIYESEDVTFSDEQLEEIIKFSPQNHKEASFDKGWDSRFDTWYKMIKEFGFIKYSMGNPIEITKTGHMLVDAYTEVPSNGKKIQKLFLNALMKYQTNNPLRRNLNENVPLPLLLKVIQYFHDDVEENDAGLARHELPILICWRNNDPKELYEYIKEIRKEVGFSCSDEYIYERCLEILETDNRNYVKMDKICHETPDEYIRKMRMTGLLSLRGNGRFLDINSFERDTVTYVIDNYLDYQKYADENEYINYMGTIDNKILEMDEAPVEGRKAVRKNTLYKIASELTKEEVCKELITVCEKKESKHELFRFINNTTRLEFLTSIALVQNFEGLDVNPNYGVDDEGMPTITAPGGFADIECYDSDYDSYFEVSLMQGRSDQVNNEIIPISRHLQEAKRKVREESFAVFVAPSVHADTIEAAEWQNMKHKVDIVAINIYDFISQIGEYDKASQFLTLLA